MKTKNYEKKTLLYTLMISIIIIEIIGIISLFKVRIYTYQRLSGVVIKKDLILLIVNDNEKKLLYKNNKLYLDNKMKTFNIKENRGKVLTRSGKDYDEIVLNVNFSNQYKANDVVNLSLRKEKYNLVKIFKIILEGD